MPSPVSWSREEDPKLYDFYAESFLEPGFLGPPPKQPDEKDAYQTACRYIAYHLEHDRGLKRKWKVKEILGRNVQVFTLRTVYKLCRWWDIHIQEEEA
jgi:hypothetical protein